MSGGPVFDSRGFLIGLISSPSNMEDRVSGTNPCSIDLAHSGGQELLMRSPDEKQNRAPMVLSS
jgi:hypothetical protein